MRTTKIFVGSLSSRTRSSDLRALFQHYGRVTECDILSSFGFVHMENANDARNAIRALNGYKLDSVRITVVLSVSNGRSGAVGDRSRFSRQVALANTAVLIAFRCFVCFLVRLRVGNGVRLSRFFLSPPSLQLAT
ncbi:hypothetical protein LSAT2_020270 [Lamellibrachia satsuma]|nr:hypothetical protein LSAT2_020270 [Lamellibrachia satsuma]